MNGVFVLCICMLILVRRFGTCYIFIRRKKKIQDSIDNNTIQYNTINRRYCIRIKRVHCVIVYNSF